MLFKIYNISAIIILYLYYGWRYIKLRIEKITENKIRIILNLQDLQEKNIDLHTFMSNSIESQDLFYDMLDEAEKEIGFKTKDYKLMIEAIAVPERKLYTNCNTHYA